MYPTKKLGEVCEIKKGKKVNYAEQGKYNYIDIGILRTNIIEQYTNDEGVFCNKNDILIAWDGSKSGTVGFGLEGVIGSTLAKITIDTKMFSSEFIGKFLQGNFDYLNKNTSGAAIPHLRKDILINLEIPLPPLPTQQKIVVKLDSLFEKLDQAITLTKQNLANIEELNKSILEKIFKECEEKYDKRKLGEVCVLVRGPFGGSLKKEIFVPEGYAVYEQQHAINNQFEQIRYFINEEKFNGMKRFELFPGDLIMSCSGTMGKIAIVPEKIIPGIINQALLKITAEKSKLFSKYLINYINSSVFQKILIENSQGAAIKNIASVKDLKQITIPLPPLPEQQKIVEYLDNIFAKNKILQEKYKQNLKNFEELKQSILKQAFENEDFIK